MRDEITRDAYGESLARLVGNRVVEVQTRGHISRANFLAASEHATKLLRDHPQVHAVLFNLTEHLGHDPGNLAQGVRWLRDHAAQLTRAGLVTRSHAYITMINIGRVMLPRLDAAAFASRDAALAWCSAAPTAADLEPPRSGRLRRSDAA